MKKRLLTIITIFFYFFVSGQTPNIVGTWKLVKHITTSNGDKNFDCMKLMPGTTILLKINADGTYEETQTDKKGKTFTTIGKCKISSDNKKYSTYNNDFKPKIPKSTIADRTHDVVKLTLTEFEFKTNFCTEDFEGISIYKKVK